MRIARKLLVVAALTAATMAFGAASASAVTVTSGGVNCSTASLSGHAVTGGCRVEAISERETQVQTFVDPPGVWVTFSTCEDHFEAAIGANGAGYLYNATTTTHLTGPQCTRQQCDEADMTKKPWALTLTSTTNMEIRFCLRSVGAANEGTAGTTCHTNIAVTPNNATGGHEFSTDGVTTGVCEAPLNTVRVLGHWNVVPSGGHPAIAIN